MHFGSFKWSVQKAFTDLVELQYLSTTYDFLDDIIVNYFNYYNNFFQNFHFG